MALAAIRKAATWQERFKLAENKEPGTPFDRLFADAMFALKMVKTKSPEDPAHTLARQILAKLGQYLAYTIERGESQHLHDMAAALNVWKRHTPKPDPIRATLIALAGMFPEHKHALAKRHVKKNLIRLKVRVDESTDKQIVRCARELGIPLCQDPGRPKKIRTKPM